MTDDPKANLTAEQAKDIVLLLGNTDKRVKKLSDAVGNLIEQSICQLAVIEKLTARIEKLEREKD